MGLSPAEKFPERFEQPAGKGCRFLWQTLELLGKWRLLAAVHLARSSRHLVGGQINVVRCPGRHASRGGELARD
jgi:hypothetical protein